MLTAVIPWPWRACCLGLLLASAGVIGWLDGASHVHKQWDAERADADSADPDPPAAGSGLRAESAGDLA